MKKHCFIYILLLAYSYSAFAGESMPPYEQSKHIYQGIESSIDDEDDDNEVEVAQKPTVLESWNKVVSLQWRSLSRDDAWNIGATVTLAGVACYFLWPSYPKKNVKTGSVVNKPPHNPFGGYTVNPLPDVECSLCFDEKKGFECHAMSCCNQIFCRECLIGGIDNELQKKSAKNLYCPNRVCTDKEQIIEQEDMDIICNTQNRPELYEAYLEATTKDLLDSEANVKQCLTPNCGSRVTIVQGPNGEITCPGCQKKYCTGCLHNHDLKMTCAQAKVQRELSENPDQAYQANLDWIKANTKQCPNQTCKKNIEKNGGCNHMTCRRCSHEFCWTCLAKYGTTACNSSGCAFLRKNNF